MKLDNMELYKPQNGRSVSLRPSPLSVSLKKTNHEAAKSPT